jgi:putative cell wall-binding protein
MDRWMISHNLGGNKWLLNKHSENKTVEYKTGIFENVKVGDVLTQVPELEDATPEEIKNAGITITDKESISITPDSELGMFFIGKLSEAVLEMAKEAVKNAGMTFKDEESITPDSEIGRQIIKTMMKLHRKNTRKTSSRPKKSSTKKQETKDD